MRVFVRLGLKLFRRWARAHRDAIHRYFLERVLHLSDDQLRALAVGDEAVYRGLRMGYIISRLRVRMWIDDFINGRVFPDR